MGSTPSMVPEMGWGAIVPRSILPPTKRLTASSIDHPRDHAKGRQNQTPFYAAYLSVVKRKYDIYPLGKITTTNLLRRLVVIIYNRVGLRN